jgi:hypothetical protein
MKWSSVDGAGNGQRDEFGLNNITISATVSAVNYPPDAVDDSESTPEDTPITIDVLANDTDLDEDVLLLDSFSQPTNGIVTRQENGTPLDTSDDSLTYTPDQDWSGEDTFTYSIDDGNGETDTATATITVTAVNDPPDAVDDNANTPEDTAVSVDVLFNDTDPELDTLNLDSFTQGSNGSVARDDNGTVGDTSDDQLVYTPAAGWSGEDSFTYTISDGNGGVDSATVTVTVEPANEPPEAMDDSETTQENSAVTIDVMFNDSDPDSDPLYLDSFTQPSNGTVERDDNGTTGDTSDDKLVYTPAGDWSGEDSFTYTIIDGNGGEATANVTVTVEALYPYTIYLPLIMR